MADYSPDSDSEEEFQKTQLQKAYNKSSQVARRDAGFPWQKEQKHRHVYHRQNPNLARELPKTSVIQNLSNQQVKPVDLAILAEWDEIQIPSILVLNMTTHGEGLMQLLHSAPLPPEWTHLFLSTLHKVTMCESQKASVTYIFKTVFESKFLQTHVMSFLEELTKGTLSHFPALAEFQKLYYIIFFALDAVPQIMRNTGSIICHIKEKGKVLGVLNEDSELSNLFDQICLKSKSLLQNNDPVRTKRKERNRISKVMTHDESDPPDDFCLITLFPDKEELESPSPLFLRANKVTGAYRDLWHYLDVQFRLLREDYVSPLRDGLKAFREAYSRGIQPNSTALRFYYNVHLVEIRFDSFEGISHVVKFSFHGHEEVDWERSKRLAFGSLLCFSKDNFNTFFFALVVNRDKEGLEKGQLEVVFQNNLEDVFTSSLRDTFVMAETTNYFESYRYVLEGLQEVRMLPLAKYIVFCDSDMDSPRHLQDSPSYNVSHICKRHCDKYEVQPLLAATWPESDETTLNGTQLEALKLGITSELAIIQGPPGTGKTYIGLKIMRLLLQNVKFNTVKEKCPILVICYTNHALDQFLEGMLPFCKNGIVRLGGRSSSELLADFNLRELRKNPKLNRHIRLDINQRLKDSRYQLKAISKCIQNIWQELISTDAGILSVTQLSEDISLQHQELLNDPSRADKRTGNVMCQWLRASNAMFENHVLKKGKEHLVKVVVLGGEQMFDAFLSDADGRNRPDLETRIKVYRGWLYQFQDSLPNKLSLVCQDSSRNEVLIEEIIRLTEGAQTGILKDKELEPYISEGVFKAVKQCVESESGSDEFGDKYIEQWLLGPYKHADQVLSMIRKLTKRKAVKHHLNRTEKNLEMDEDDGRQVIALSDSEDDDEDENMGFHFDEETDENNTTDSDSDSFQSRREIHALEAKYKDQEDQNARLLQEAELLNVNLSECQNDESFEETWETVNKMTYSQVTRLLENCNAFSAEEVKNINNPWGISLRDRYRLYKYWLTEKKKKLANSLTELTCDYKRYLKLKINALNKKDIEILKRARIIGMTTTGAAKYREVVQAIQAKIIIVEEAAEVLEGHIITSLNKHCQHLILIGDHQQLRPNPTVHELATHYNLEISLFERLLKNKIQHVTLQEQHRMRPEISMFLRHIYPHLIDHYSVKLYPNVSGISSNVFFLNHEYDEIHIPGSLSISNVHEAKFITSLCKYLIQQGYTGNQITILAAYKDQVDALHDHQVEEPDTFENVRITSIDNYQGEENDIILLSLVRSNKENNVGFLKISNRVCVALSRAKHGLYAVGNLSLLANESDLWKKILGTANANGLTGRALELVCVNHTHHSTYVSCASHFLTEVPEGGCNRPCGTTLNCGHICPRMCHASDQLHAEYLCRQPCLRSNCPENHPCPKECWEDCGDCDFPVEKLLPICGHTDFILCHVDPAEAICSKPCGQLLECGHICKGKCGKCFREEEHFPCQVKVEKQWQCGHTNTTDCCTDVKTSPCPTPCRSLLSCGHKCGGDCGTCLNGKVHKVCLKPCSKTLPCGHQCQSKCSVPCTPCKKRCPFICRHKPCSEMTCGDQCSLCMEDCAMVCKHVKCFKKCIDKCTKGACQRLCSKLELKCQHKCVSICGEECVCFQCEKGNFVNLGLGLKGKQTKVFEANNTTVFIKIPRCKHFFTVEHLDRYVKNMDHREYSYIKCPVCPNTIQGVRRYEAVNKERFLMREAKKELLEKAVFVSQNDVDLLVGDNAKLKDFVTLGIDHLPSEDSLDFNHARAIRYQIRFAYVLKEICEVHQHFNKTVEFAIHKWKKTLLSPTIRVTEQFIQEASLELQRLLLSEEFLALKGLIDDLGYTLPTDMKEKYKIVVRTVLRSKLSQDKKTQAEDFSQEMYALYGDEPKNAPIIKTAADLRKKIRNSKYVLEQPDNMNLSEILQQFKETAK